MKEVRYQDVYFTTRHFAIVLVSAMTQGKMCTEFTICTDKEIAIGYHYAQNGCESIMDIYPFINNELRKLSFEKYDDDKKEELLDFAKQFEKSQFNCKIEERLKAVLPVLYKKDFSFLDDEEVISWNERMAELSYNQLFSDKKSILESYRIGE